MRVLGSWWSSLFSRVIFKRWSRESCCAEVVVKQRRALTRGWELQAPLLRVLRDRGCGERLNSPFCCGPKQAIFMVPCRSPSARAEGTTGKLSFQSFAEDNPTGSGVGAPVWFPDELLEGRVWTLWPALKARLSRWWCPLVTSQREYRTVQLRRESFWFSMRPTMIKNSGPQSLFFLSDWTPLLCVSPAAC